MSPSDIEQVARILHETGEQAVEMQLVYRTDLPVRPFCPWDELPLTAKAGRLLQAKALCAHPEIKIEYVDPKVAGARPGLTVS